MALSILPTPGVLSAALPAAGVLPPGAGTAAPRVPGAAGVAATLEAAQPVQTDGVLAARVGRALVAVEVAAGLRVRVAVVSGRADAAGEVVGDAALGVQAARAAGHGAGVDAAPLGVAHLVPRAVAAGPALELGAAEGSLALVSAAAEAHRLVEGDVALGVGAAVADGAGVGALAAQAGLVGGAVEVGPAAGDAAAVHAPDAVLAVGVGAARLEALSVGGALLAAAAVVRPLAGLDAKAAGAGVAGGTAAAAAAPKVVLPACRVRISGGAGGAGTLQDVVDRLALRAVSARGRAEARLTRIWKQIVRLN